MTVATVSVPPGASAPQLPVLLRAAAQALRQGGLVAFPTETVYGLGADAFNPEAVERIYKAKKRPADNPLIIHLPHQDWMDRVTGRVTPLARRLAGQYWPGPLTMVLSAAPSVPSQTLGGLATVAVRVPAHRMAQALITTADTPVAGPSANLSGRPSPTTAAHVLADLDGRIDWIVDGGPCALGIESTVVDARGAHPVVLREGSITREMLGVKPDDRRPAGDSVSPGTRHRHYQPDARVVIAPMNQGGVVAQQMTDLHSVGLVGPRNAADDSTVRLLARPLGAAELGSVLYSALRQADSLGLDVVVVEAVPADGVGRAVMDRLQRAAGIPPAQPLGTQPITDLA